MNLENKNVRIQICAKLAQNNNGKCVRFATQYSTCSWNGHARFVRENFCETSGIENFWYLWVFSIVSHDYAWPIVNRKTSGYLRDKFLGHHSIFYTKHKPQLLSDVSYSKYSYSYFFRGLHVREIRDFLPRIGQKVQFYMKFVMIFIKNLRSNNGYKTKFGRSKEVFFHHQ